jgi:hypothetical protein
MMNVKPKEDGGAAFPNGGGHPQHCGMSLRDYFAAHVMERMISLSSDQDGGWDVNNVAHGCYQLADAMLRARSEPAR